MNWRIKHQSWSLYPRCVYVHDALGVPGYGSLIYGRRLEFSLRLMRSVDVFGGGGGARRTMPQIRTFKRPAYALLSVYITRFCRFIANATCLSTK